jgi:LemA protein
LQTQLEGTENRVAVERQRYNQAVRELNTFCRWFFGRIYAGWAGVEPGKYFEAVKGAEETPQVDFGSGESP